MSHVNIEVDVAVTNWPSRSLDLNPIEHLWDDLTRRVRARNPAPPSREELQAVLTEEWNDIPEDHIKNLIESIRNRLLSEPVGDNIKY